MLKISVSIGSLLYNAAISNQIDVLPIALVCFAGNLTIFAFAFPYIFRAVRDISKVSEILSKRCRQKKLVKQYPKFLVLLFIIYLVMLTSCFFVKQMPYLLAFILLLLLLCHVFYVIFFYMKIDDIIAKPMDYLEWENNSKKEREDIFLIQDLILFSIKTGENESQLNKYTEEFIKITFRKFNNYLKQIIESEIYWHSLDFLTTDGEKKRKDLELPIDRMLYMNKRAIDANNTEFLNWVDYFFKCLLEYDARERESQKDDNFTKAYPDILYPHTKLLQIKKQIQQDSNKYQHDAILNFCEYLNKEFVSEYAYAILYRIKKEVFSEIDIDNVVYILFYVINNSEIFSTNIYERPFSLLKGLIDSNYDKNNFALVLRNIKEKYYLIYCRDYYKYKKIMAFHINVLAYMLFSNKCDLFWGYINLSEGAEAEMNHVCPQIPNSIDVIFDCFMMPTTVFDNVKVFSENTSSYKYKYFTLFALLLNSKQIGDRLVESLAKTSKDNFVYSYLQKKLQRHTEISKEFIENYCWDEILLAIKLDSYDKYLDEFLKQDELLTEISFKQEYADFIRNIMDVFIKSISENRANILNSDIKKLTKQSFSKQLQEKLKFENIDEYINILLNLVANRVKNINVVENLEVSDQIKLDLLDMEYDKEQFLLNVAKDYRDIFITEFENHIFAKIFNEMSKICDEIKDISKIAENNLSNFIILSNNLSKQTFEKFIESKDIISSSEANKISGVRINGIEIKVAVFNHYFERANLPHFIMFIDKSKFTILKGDNIKIEFTDISSTNKVLVSDKTKIILKIQNKIGYKYLDATEK
jgi:hypothetical protein